VCGPIFWQLAASSEFTLERVIDEALGFAIKNTLKRELHAKKSGRTLVA
jgi:hypothetical protein